MTLLNASNQFTPLVTSSSKSLDGVDVSLNLALLLRETKHDINNSIEMHLDEDSRIILYETAVRNKKDSENFSWFGENPEESIEAVFSIRNGLLVGSIYMRDTSYEIRPKNGHYSVKENIPSKDMTSFEGDTVLVKQRSKGLDLHVKSPESSAVLQRQTGDATIDVMLLYTAEFKKHNGDVADAVAQNLFDVAYGAYKRSLTQVNLNLVYLDQLPTDSVLNDTSNIFASLKQLKVDGYVRELRKKYGADMVSLIGRNTLSNEHCGLANKPLDPDSRMIDAFSISFNGPGNHRYCDNLTLAHEMGHNFGCGHDSDHNGSKGMYAYSHGYDIVDEFATIMSYDEPNIRYFSNPDIIDTIYKVPIGDAQTADNARTIRDNRFKMADNSNHLEDVLEPGDRQDGLYMDGYLTSNDDRDSYFVNLGGATRFSAQSPGYKCWYFYIYLYDENHEFIFQTDADSGDNCGYAVDTVLDNGTYEMMIYSSNWRVGDNIVHYKIDVETSYEPPEGNSSTLYDALANGEFSITGKYSMYDFDGDGQDAFDWAFETSEGLIYRLQGEAPTSANVFGWKLVHITPTKPLFIMSYLGDYDHDGDSRFDWIVVDLKSKAVYKLEGVNKEGNFEYSDRIEMNPILSDNSLRFETK